MENCREKREAGPSCGCNGSPRTMNWSSYDKIRINYYLPRLRSFAAFAFLVTWPETRLELITANLSPYGQIINPLHSAHRPVGVGNAAAPSLDKTKFMRKAAR
ncbi:MAG: hypothetical protein GY847_39005 [Proteobacteria bacterium]|nr:hypothetical protein [Pseudomonadota bacterium]